MPCVKSGARAGSLYRNLVAHALTLGASGDRAPVRQQPCNVSCVCETLEVLRNSWNVFVLSNASWNLIVLIIIQYNNNVKNL